MATPVVPSRLAARGAAALVRNVPLFRRNMRKVCAESVAQLLGPDREEPMKKILAALVLSSWCDCLRRSGAPGSPAAARAPWAAT